MQIRLTLWNIPEGNHLEAALPPSPQPLCPHGTRQSPWKLSVMSRLCTSRICGGQVRFFWGKPSRGRFSFSRRDSWAPGDGPVPFAAGQALPHCVPRQGSLFTLSCVPRNLQESYVTGTHGLQPLSPANKTRPGPQPQTPTRGLNTVASLCDVR